MAYAGPGRLTAALHERARGDGAAARGAQATEAAPTAKTASAAASAAASRRRRLAGLASALFAASASACGGADPAARPAAPGPAAPGPAAAAGWEGGAWGRFRSARFDVSVELPDGKAWRINDRRGPWLVAEHAPTDSRLRLRAFRDDDPRNWRTCEARARELDPSLPPLEGVVEERAEGLLAGWDARAWALLRPAPDGSIEGHYLFVAARIRKCLVAHYATRARGPAAGAVLGARLGDVAERIVGGLRADDELEGPGCTPPPAP
ncbi:MAG TPA: hypothetical protein VFS00_21310 [Polyangiaceae bacterium]|nr:hypothetical protein [Polyangiaceae bacterium]